MISRSWRTYLFCSLGRCYWSLARTACVTEIAARSSSWIATDTFSSYWLKPSAEADSGECFFSTSMSRLANSLLRAIQLLSGWLGAEDGVCEGEPASAADLAPGTT